MGLQVSGSLDLVSQRNLPSRGLECTSRGDGEGSAGTCCFLGVFKIIKVVCIITCYIPLIRVTAWKRSLST